jgi:membrane protein YdbS with pleckstrin-like domain
MKQAFLRLMKVPARPHLPAGDPRSARVFRAGPNYWRLKLLAWALKQLVLLAALRVMTPFAFSVGRIGVALMVVAGSLWVAQAAIGLVVARLDYEMRWYIVTDRAARLREGIFDVREMTLTLTNVQDIRIAQGPLERLLGLSDVELRTAGGSEPVPGTHGAADRNLHLARFRGVEAALAGTIRDLIRERMKKSRDAGLGDPHEPEPREQDPVLAAARELGREAAALRACLPA